MPPTLMAATLVARLDIVPVPVATLAPVMPSVAPLVAVPGTVVVAPVVPAAGPAPITTPVLAVPVTTTGIPVTALCLEAVRCTIACIVLIVPVTPIRPVATVLPAVGVSSVAAVPTGAVTVPAPAAAMTVVAT